MSEINFNSSGNDHWRSQAKEAKINEAWGKIQHSQNGEEVFLVIRSFILPYAQEGAGSAVFHKIGKEISAVLKDQNEWLVFLQKIWDKGGRAGKLIGLSLLSEKVDDSATIIPVLYRLALSAESQEIAQKLAVGVLQKIVEADRENFEELLSQWQEDENEGVSEMARVVKERIR